MNDFVNILNYWFINVCIKVRKDTDLFKLYNFTTLKFSNRENLQGIIYVQVLMCMN